MAKQDMIKGQQPKDIFDVKRIREIIELMEEHDLSAVDLQQGDEKIKLNRGSVSPVYSAPPTVAAAAGPVPAAGPVDLKQCSFLHCQPL